MVSALQRYMFDVWGYLQVENVLSVSEVDVLRRAIDQQDLAPGSSIQDQRFGGDGRMLGWHAAFRALIDHPMVLDVLRVFIGPHVRLDHAYGIMMSPGTSGLGLHGPSLPFDPSQYYVYRSGTIRTGLLSFTWALNDARPGQGGFGCIPGSHRAEEPLPAGSEQLVVELPQRAGSLLVFTEALAHCTVPWNGDDTRWSLLYKYSPGSSAWGATPAASGEVLELFTERQRRFVEPPYVGGRSPAF